MLNPPETVYRFLVQLFAEVKQNYDAVVVATVEQGMHSTQALAAMEQLFDGAVELTLYQKGLRVIPLLRVVKMRGLPPQPGFFRYNFVDGKMEIEAYVR
jgi:KaiC/GvpD/RAD55 family RecA-like ATPase